MRSGIQLVYLFQMILKCRACKHFLFSMRKERTKINAKTKVRCIIFRYYPVNGMDSGSCVQRLRIKDMKGKWTTILFHAKMSKDPKKGFMKMYVDDILYNVFEGRTSLGESIQ